MLGSIGAASLQLLECLELLELCSWQRAVAMLDHRPEIADWSKNGLNQIFVTIFLFFFSYFEKKITCLKLAPCMADVTSLNSVNKPSWLLSNIVTIVSIV